MSLQRADFAAFFREVHGGHDPFAWQERLLDELLETGIWPSRIVAPTGAGKTAAIDVHVFAVALAAGRQAPRLPRRLSMVVGRRVLVDDQYEHATRLADALGDAREGVLAEVAAQLRELCRPADPQRARAHSDAAPLVVARLRGGTAPSRDWRDEPTVCAVICATPDMWGSRLLFRGYGTAPRARSREAGLLAVDAAVVVDEAHLSRQLLTTAQGVARLVPAAEQPLPLPVLQVVETTATPAPGTSPGRSVGVDQEDLDGDPVLRDRMKKPKPVGLVPTKDWPATSTVQCRRVAALMADEVIGVLAHPSAGTPTVGCYVNTVRMAVEVAQALRTRTTHDGRPPRVVTVCGQTRPADLNRLPDKLLSVTGNPTVDVLVTTQSLEVGVDLDLAGVVTELAPGSALAQRAGRANRRGLRPAAPVRVIVPDGTLTDRSRSGPYQPDDLREALDWLRRRAADPSGLAPWSVRDDPPRQAARQRTLYQRPEMGDAWQWARTCDALAAEPELDLWLAESVEADSSAGIVVRDAMPADPLDAVALVRALPVRDDEVFTVPLATARSVLARAVQVKDPAADAERPQAVVRRGDDITVADPKDVRPGDLVVIDSRTAAFTASATGSGDVFSPPTPVAADPDSGDAVPVATADDLLHAVPAPGPGQVVVRLEAGAWPGAAPVLGLLKQYADLPEDATGRVRRDTLRTLLTDFAAELSDHSGTAMIRAAIGLLRGPVHNSDIILDRDENEQPVRLILLDKRRAASDEQMRQKWLPVDTPVPLDDHQIAVAERAAWIGRYTHLPPPLVETLRVAGRHHDDGKEDPRFQAGLGATDQVLAKSGGRSASEFRDSTRKAGLPEGWRHEQRSVLACWTAVHDALPPEYARLAARLVGTSHGHGRHGFPHAAAELLAPGAPEADLRLAQDLFDLGIWDELIEATHHRWGAWACAYLEALLRAADGQVSGEGT